MASIGRLEKLGWFLFIIVYFAVGYVAIDRFWANQHHASFFDPSIGVDHLIPFVPAFVLGYLLVYAGVIMLYFTIDTVEDCHRGAVAFFATTTVAYIFFLILPVRMDIRLDLSGQTGIFVAINRFYHSIDPPYNCLPSIHIAYPTLYALITWRNHKVMRWVFAAMTAIVSVSVLLVRQHYLADIAAGIATAGLCFWLTVKLEPVWSRLFRSSSKAPLGAGRF
jgi:hypothetical protein